MNKKIITTRQSKIKQIISRSVSRPVLKLSKTAKKAITLVKRLG
jgi:hypothetical protein